MPATSPPSLLQDPVCGHPAAGGCSREPRPVPRVRARHVSRRAAPAAGQRRGRCPARLPHAGALLCGEAPCVLPPACEKRRPGLCGHVADGGRSSCTSLLVSHLGQTPRLPAWTAGRRAARATSPTAPPCAHIRSFPPASLAGSRLWKQAVPAAAAGHAPPLIARRCVQAGPAGG